MFTQTDLLQFQQKGADHQDIVVQIEMFKKGFPFLNVTSPATPGNGLFQPDMGRANDYVEYYNNSVTGKRILKFVPASGAATRMFKSFFEFLSNKNSSEIPSEIQKFADNLQKFAFYDDLKDTISKNGDNIDKLIEKKDFNRIVQFLINKNGLNYGEKPKGLLKFHKYADHSRTALEEHLVEGAEYACASDGFVNLHFTVSTEHLQGFKELVEKVSPYFQKKFGVQYNISFSIQKSSTDTIAVDQNNNPFRDDTGKLIFRPGGHGALLENLNDLEADLIFIKNIDNVVPDRLKADTVFYKKVLGGLLLKYQDKIFHYIKAIEQSNLSASGLNEIKNFIEENLGYHFQDGFENLDESSRRELMLKILSRPLRVCGMVKNTGEPGGGPFWVKGKKGEQTLQILESSQFNMNDPLQNDIFKRATHFNPVDLVISAKDYKGNKFDLRRFRDPETGFISIKSKDGKELKALELPGLWNGAMADWNTVFVEVPISTFNPVKTVLDLLRNEHLNEI